MMDIKGFLLQWLIDFFDKLSATRANKCAGGAVKNGKYIKPRIS